MVGVVALVVLAAAALGRAVSSDASAASPTPGLVTGQGPASPIATSLPTTEPTPGETTEPTAEPTIEPTATPAPTAEPTPTDPPTAKGDPRVLYAKFLDRINDDRTTVEGLNTALSTAAQAQDTAGVHDASVQILDFVDNERLWLKAHPPAACYTTAHHAARTMLVSYATAAERFLDWSGGSQGLGWLDALGKAIDAAKAAGDDLTAFGHALEATRCPG